MKTDDTVLLLPFAGKQPPVLSWLKDGAAGRIDPNLLAPDPKQPRKHMDTFRFAELVASIKTCGVRSSIVVTLRAWAPWAGVLPEHTQCPLLIVSGHRRVRAALEAGCADVPIEVRRYPNEKEHRSDVSLLNKGQDPLSELEEGFEILELKKAGWTLQDLSFRYGWNVLTIRYRLQLTQLDPEIQRLIDPGTTENEKKRLQITIAQHLGSVRAITQEELESLADRLDEDLDTKQFKTEDERRFALQRLLLRVIKKKGMNSQRATIFIKDLVLEQRGDARSGSIRGRHHQPQRRRGVLETLCKDVANSPVLDWKPDEFRRVFDNASREEVEESLAQVRKSRDVLDGVARNLEKVVQSKKATSPEVLALLKRESR